MNIDELSLLQACRLLLDDRRAWTQGAYARRNGEACPATVVKANQWCLIGSTEAFGASHDIEDAVKYRLRELAAPSHNVLGYNDRDSTHHADVLELLDLAIEQCVQEGAEV